MTCHHQPGGRPGSGLEGEARDQPEQQRRPSRAVMAPVGISTGQKRVRDCSSRSVAASSRAPAPVPTAGVGRAASPQHAHHDGGRQADETDQPHYAHHAGGDEDREAEAGESQVLEGDPQAAGAGIVQLQHCQGTGPAPPVRWPPAAVATGSRPRSSWSEPMSRCPIPAGPLSSSWKNSRAPG